MRIIETENQTFRDCHRIGRVCPALSATKFSQGGGGSDDYSQSTSEAAQQGGSIASPFSVGGGLKIPDWVWAGGFVLTVLIVGAVVWKKIFGK